MKSQNLIKEKFNEYYQSLNDYENSTGRMLPTLVAAESDKKNISALLSELTGVLGCDEWSAAHFLLEQMVMMNRAADWCYIESAEVEESEEETMKEVVDTLAATADDYMTTAGYLLYKEYGMI